MLLNAKFLRAGLSPFFHTFLILILASKLSCKGIRREPKINPKEVMVRIKLFHLTLLVASLMLLLALGSLAAARAVEGGQQGLADDQKYAGTWTGTYSSEGGDTEKVTITLSKDEKGHWRGTIKYIDQDGEQTAELKSLQISGGKFKAKIESTDASAEITLEGEFQGTRFEGTYSVSEKGSTEIAEKGIWKTARSSAPKTER